MSQSTGVLSAQEIRARFLAFFEARAHTVVPSSTTCPMNDPSLRDTFANAGMNQFKPIFQGTLEPGSPLEGLTRATDTQKCIRAGGKHNDLDDVGKDTYHHTFFEMLGNWSFGDYFKDETIAWAWELMTGKLEDGCFGLDPDRLYATYFGGDESAGLEPDLEAKALWERHLPPERVMAFGMKDNFWEMGDTGPCGPCSELHYDRVGGRDASGLVNMDDPEVIELWNLVFIQFDRISATELKTLPAKHVDTGMGLERIVSVLQDKTSNYDTDLFGPLFAKIKELTGARGYTGKLGADDTDGVDEAYRVIADHVRTLVVAITDGGMPSNEGRGYVLRRILRRAVRYGRQKLGAPEGFLTDLAPTVVEVLGDVFPELKSSISKVTDVIRDEEESFGRTLEKGIKVFDDIALDQIGYHAVNDAPDFKSFSHIEAPQGTDYEPGTFFARYKLTDREGTIGRAVSPSEALEITRDAAITIPGEDAFKLYDTYGFPLDLTEIMAHERGMTVDRAGFERAMEEAKERSRHGGRKDDGAARIELRAEHIAHLKDTGVRVTDDGPKFRPTDLKTCVKALFDGDDFVTTAAAGSRVGIVLEKTNFYAEMGGQVADVGTIRRGHDAVVRVEDTQSFGGYVVHIGTVERGKLHAGDAVTAKIDRKRRSMIAANHTATHLLNLALRKTIGGDVDQRGSLVNDEKLRFDFTHGAPVSPEELGACEHIINAQIAQDLTVHSGAAPLGTAKTITGLRAVFDETYPDPVRVVSVGAPIAELIADPGKSAWGELSVEFCGGTHLDSTGAAKRCAIVSEEGIAKGTRRVTALTGDAAEDAYALAEALKNEIAGLTRLDGAALKERFNAMTAKLEESVVPASAKHALRAQLGAVQATLKEADKARAAERAAAAEALAKQVASAASGSSEDVVITTLELGSDRGALEAAVATIQKAVPNKAVMVLSPDPDSGRVAVMASVSESMIASGLKAGEWIKETTQIMGGKGGGRPNAAQGSGTDLSKLKEAAAHARRFAYSKVKG